MLRQFDCMHAPGRNFMVLAALAGFLAASCNKPSSEKTTASGKPSQAELDALVRQRAEELVGEKERSEQRIGEEALKISEERAKLAQMASEKRQEIAADLATREGSAEARRAANLETAATEMARRETASAEVKEFVDSLEIYRSKINETVKIQIGSDDAKPDMALVSPAGYTVRFKKQDGDYFVFEYEDDGFSLLLKRTLKGLSISSITHKKPLAEGVPADTSAPFSLPSSGSSFTPIGGLTIMSATYGAENVHRDVKDIIKSKSQNGSLDFSANSGELGGDPIFGKVKELRIKYLHRGRIVEKAFREGDRVSIP